MYLHNSVANFAFFCEIVDCAKCVVKHVFGFLRKNGRMGRDGLHEKGICGLPERHIQVLGK